MRILTSLPALALLCLAAFGAAASVPVLASAAPVIAQAQPAVIDAAPLDRQHVVGLLCLALPLIALLIKRAQPLEHWIHRSWAIGLSAVVAGALNVAAQAIAVRGLNAYAVIYAVIGSLTTALAMAPSTPSDGQPGGKLPIPPIPPAAMVLALLSCFLALPACGGQFRAALREQRAAELQRAQATRRAVRDFRDPACDAACQKRNLDLIDALAAGVSP